MSVFYVQSGAPITFSTQFEDGENSLPKVVKIIVRDFIGSVLYQKTAMHIGNGLFICNGFLMPDKPSITCQYLVFEEDGVTPADDFTIEYDQYLQPTLIGGNNVSLLANEYAVDYDTDSGQLSLQGNKRIKIVRGQDISVVLKIRSKSNGDPLDLTNNTEIKVIATKSNRSNLVFTNKLSQAVKASVTIGSVIVSADNAGYFGNGIELICTQGKTIQEVVDAWNLANPTKTVSFEPSVSGVVVPEVGEYVLTGGLDAYNQITPFGNPLLGKIKVKMIDALTSVMRIGLNQSLNIEIDFGSHPSGERIIAQLKNAIDVVDGMD